MRIKFIVTLISAAVLSLNVAVKTHAQGTPTESDSIRYAIEYQREHYPASQYRDIYKNFMQDFFGPGHILSDTEAARRYLDSELNTTTVFDGPLFEPTGYRGNFYRVNLGLIADGTIPYDVFFEAFVRSVQGITPPEPEYWMNIWNTIDKEITAMGLTFSNEESDRAELARQFETGNYIVHHSKAYNNSVNFHYRIIARDIFLKTILPYIRTE